MTGVAVERALRPIEKTFEEKLDAFNLCLTRVEVILETTRAWGDRAAVVDAQDMVNRAISYYNEHGAEEAFAKISAQPQPEFLDGDVHTWVAQMDGEIVAHSAWSTVWKGELVTDHSGWWDNVFTTEQFRAKAQSTGVGFVWSIPTTESNWIVPHDGYLFAATFPSR